MPQSIEAKEFFGL
jgi:hypothetical protein